MSEEELESAKKEMEEILINELINFVRDGADPKSDKSAQMKCYNIVYNFTEKGFAENLLNYHNEKVTGITKEIYEKIKNLSGIDFIDSFILYTERLNALFFHLSRIFLYISFYYLKGCEDKNNVRKFVEDDITEFSMLIYKECMFNKLENKILDALNESFAQEKINENMECKEKIMKIMKIINDMDIIKPKIIKINEKSYGWKERSSNDKIKANSGHFKKFEDFFKKIGLKLENN